MWYKNEGQDIHGQFFKQLNAIMNRQMTSYTLDDRHFRLYTGKNLYSMFTMVGDVNIGGNTLGINIVQMAIEALLSKMTKTAPRVAFLTDGGDWTAQQKAEGLERFTDGQFHQSRTYHETKKAGLDAFIWGDGLVKIYSKNHGKRPRICTQRVATPFVITDEREAIHGEPLTQYQIEFVDRDSLKAQFPDMATAINEAGSKGLQYFDNMILDTNLVLVVEGWRVADSNGEGGRHFVGVSSATLVNEEYKKNYLPFSRLVYQRNPLGYRSKGVAELLTSHQIELNDSLRRLQDAFRLSAPKWLYDYGSKIVKTHFNNLAGGLIGYQGTPPQYYAPAPVPPQHFDYIFFIIQKALEEIGLNQLTVTGTKPAGLNSGKALREHNDIETERFASLLRDWENFHVDIALKCIKEAKYLADIKKPIEVKAPIGDSIKNIVWKDVDMPIDSFIMKPYPMSGLSKTPQGKREDVQDLINMQMIDPHEGMMLLDIPDTKQLTSRKYAYIDDIKATVSMMIDTGEYLPPEEFQDLEFGISYCQSSYLYYRNRKCPQDRLDLLDQWINDALDLLQPTQVEGEAMPEEMLSDEIGEIPMEMSEEEMSMAQMGEEELLEEEMPPEIM